MPIPLGVKPQHGFDQPLGLLGDCHRRIESFLAVMIRVLERTSGSALAPDERRGLETALAYFDTAAPRHTQDEDESLFPRLRASGDPAALAAMARVDALEADHRRAETLHAQAGKICRQWLATDRLEPSQAEHLNRLLTELRDIYVRHIAVEDDEIFPLAAQVLSKPDLEQIGTEMATRRGLRRA